MVIQIHLLVLKFKSKWQLRELMTSGNIEYTYEQIDNFLSRTCVKVCECNSYFQVDIVCIVYVFDLDIS